MNEIEALEYLGLEGRVSNIRLKLRYDLLSGIYHPTEGQEFPLMAKINEAYRVIDKLQRATAEVAFIDREIFERVYRLIETMHDREVTELDVNRAYKRYEKIVIKGE
jgi:hypothetical protein